MEITAREDRCHQSVAQIDPVDASSTVMERDLRVTEDLACDHFLVAVLLSLCACRSASQPVCSRDARPMPTGLGGCVDMNPSKNRQWERNVDDHKVTVSQDGQPMLLQSLCGKEA